MKNKHLYVALPATKFTDGKGFDDCKEIKTEFRSNAAHTHGFTLAETLITLVILGVVAALTIPSLVRKQVEASNRVKIKKAMGVYETLVNKLAVENNLKSNAAIQEWADADCTNSSDLFKVVKFVSTANKCQFKTADGVFWDISNIQSPIIALRETDLNEETAQSETNRAFYLFSQFDNQGILRVTEKPFTYDLTTGYNKDEVNASVERLYDYINGKSSTSQEKVKGCDIVCIIARNSQNQCAYVNGQMNRNAKSCTYGEIEEIDGDTYYLDFIVYDENGAVILGSSDNYCETSDDCFFTNEYIENTRIDESAIRYDAEKYLVNLKRLGCNHLGENCSSSIKVDYSDDFTVSKYYKCNGNGEECEDTPYQVSYNDPVNNKVLSTIDCTQQSCDSL